MTSAFESDRHSTFENRSEKLLKPSSVGFVLVGTSLALIKRDVKPGLHDSGLWSIPGGEVDIGETYLNALYRELYEEIRLDITKIAKKPVLIGGSPVMGAVHGLYIVQLLEEERQNIVLGNEGQQLRYINIDLLRAISPYLGVNLRGLVDSGLPEFLSSFLNDNKFDFNKLKAPIVNLP